MNLLKVSITGPESTGKSWLAEQLARYYRTAWVPEFSREYLDILGRPYRYEDILEIARGQIRIENETAQKADRILFCDTDPLVTKIWGEFKYGHCDPWILDQVQNHRYNLYLLCNIDLPWEPDPLREHPDKRKELIDLYKRNLQNLGVTWKVVSGVYQDRLKNAIRAIEETFEERLSRH